MRGGDRAVGPELAGHPLVGHLLAFRRDRVGLLDSCVAAPGDVIELRIARRTYVLKRAEDVRHVLVTAQPAYAKHRRNIGPRARRILGDGLLTSNGEAHRRMRRRVQPGFRRGSVAPLNEVIVRGVDAMLDCWMHAVEVDLADEMTALALQNLTASIFGVESGSELAVLEHGVIARRRSINRAFASLLTLPAFLPIARWPRERRAIRRLDETLDQLIRQQRNEAASSPDLLSTVKDRHGGFSASERRRVKGEALTFALAGYENVARALTWTLLSVVRRPDVEAKLRAEVHRVLGDRKPTADDCTKLRYTEMTVAESMRLWPPTAAIVRVAKHDDVLPTGTRIRAGSKVFLSPYVVQRDPAYFPDPERFEPERFREEGDGGRPRYAYFPFGGGRRVCIGQPLATLQLVLVLARTAQRVHLELSGSPPPYTDASLPPGYGPRMRVRSSR
jgi:cytochrome P450